MSKHMEKTYIRYEVEVLHNTNPYADRYQILFTNLLGFITAMAKHIFK
jgi:hypothetical protein